MLDSLKKIYYRLPQRLFWGYSTYAKYRRLISRTEFLNQSEIEAFQYAQLKTMVDYAWAEIEGYHKLWEKNGFHPDMLRTLKDIEKIPFVTRQMLKENIQLFSNTKRRGVRHITTGGSSGEPFAFYHQTKNIFIEQAFIHDMWSRFMPNVNLKSKRVALRGHKIKGLFFIKPANVMLLSSYALDVKNVKKIIEAIEFYKAPILHVYPSSIYLLAKIIKDNNLQLNHQFSLTALSSEPLMPFQTALVKEVFNTKISHWYGHSEKAVLAGYCEKNETFHAFPQYGITEVVDSEGRAVQKGDVGEIVGTSFWNFATPFIRYKTHDYAEWGENHCPDCQRNYQILNRIEGRLQDYVVDKDGHLISLTALIFAQHFEAFENIISMKLVQSKKGAVIVNIVGSEHFTNTDADEVANVMIEVTNRRLDVEVKIVENIERTALGKQPFLKQHLNINDYN